MEQATAQSRSVKTSKPNSLTVRLPSIYGRELLQDLSMEFALPQADLHPSAGFPIYLSRETDKPPEGSFTFQSASRTQLKRLTHAAENRYA